MEVPIILQRKPCSIRNGECWFVETPKGMDILRIGVDFILARVRDKFEVKYGMRTDGWRIRSARIRHL